MDRIQYTPFKKLPPGARCVTRISRWGNPYIMIEHGGEYTREEAIALYREYVAAMAKDDRERWLAPLCTMTALACCPPHLACHADVLIEFLDVSA